VSKNRLFVGGSNEESTVNQLPLIPTHVDQLTLLGYDSSMTWRLVTFISFGE